jgi:hypothetical protein
MTVTTSTRIVARLLRDGYVTRTEAPELMDANVIEDVRARLNTVGLDLHLSLHSDAYGVSYSRDAATELGDDWQHRLIKRNVAALIVVVWTRLILPLRLVQESETRRGQQPLPGLELAIKDAEEGRVLTTSVDQIMSDFGKRFGNRDQVEKAFSTLKRLVIVEYEKLSEIRAGPMLDVLLPGPQMKAYVEREMRAVLVTDAAFDPKNLPQVKGGS